MIDWTKTAPERDDVRWCGRPLSALRDDELATAKGQNDALFRSMFGSLAAPREGRELAAIMKTAIAAEMDRRNGASVA